VILVALSSNPARRALMMRFPAVDGEMWKALAAASVTGSPFPQAFR
jgi:hypothetical protein